MLQIVEQDMTYREAAAKRIKTLMEKWTANTLELGAELAKVRETFPINEKRPGERPGFAKWAKKETGLSAGHITNLILVHKKFGLRGHIPRLAGQVMILLSHEDVPESARLEALSRAEKGEHVGHTDAKKIAKVHKLPKPKEANRMAKEEGHPVLASDGFIYFGTDPAKAKEGQDRRKMVFGVRDALEHLSSINLTGREFLAYAFPHQLSVFREEPIIKKALRWLVDLDKAWDAHE